MKKLLEALASSLGKENATEFANSIIGEDNTLKEGYETILKDSISTVKTKFYNDGKIEGKTEGKKEGKGWAERELKTQWEKELSETLGVEAAPIKEMASKFKETIMAGVKTKEITDNDILNHKIYQDLVSSHKIALDESNGKLNEVLTAQQQSKTLGRVLEEISPLFQKKYLGTDKALKDVGARYVASHKLKDIDGKLIPVDENDMPIRMQGSADVFSLVDHIESTHLTGYFPLKEANPNTPGDKGIVTGGGETKFVVPSGLNTAKQWSQAINNETDPAKKQQLVEASRGWEAANR